MRSLRLIIAGMTCGLWATAAQAQVRGLPLFFDPTYSFTSRVGADIGNGGELDGFVWALGASHLIRIGTRDRLALSAGGGTWNPPGERSGGFNGGATASYLLNCSPSPRVHLNPTYRVVGGAGLTRAEGRTIFNAPLGLQAGYMIEWSVIRLEPWITARAHYLESPRTEGRSTWRIGLSTGFNLGVASVVGARVAADFGTGRFGIGGGLSYWW